jgi:hypothetical protein
MEVDMDDLIRHGVEARADWREYYSALEAADARYHNRPDCVVGAAIDDVNMRWGTADRPLCDTCHSAEHPNK